MTTTDDVEVAQEREYGTYVAVGPIFLGGARAFNAGDPVPASHIERGVVDVELVERVTPAAAATTTKAPAPKPVADKED